MTLTSIDKISSLQFFTITHTLHRHVLNPRTTSIKNGNIFKNKVLLFKLHQKQPDHKSTSITDEQERKMTTVINLQFTEAYNTTLTSLVYLYFEVYTYSEFRYIL